MTIIAEALGEESDRPCTGMNITEVTDITEAQKATLKALGAVESDLSIGG